MNNTVQYVSHRDERRSQYQQRGVRHGDRDVLRHHFPEHHMCEQDDQEGHNKRDNVSAC